MKNSNREIKFRIWDKQFNKFLYQLPEKHHLDWERFDIHQFTGLLDKLEKEIYEGDIMQVLPNGTEPRTLWIVVWVDDCYELHEKKERPTDSEHIMPLYPIDDFIVIGNIYENPELLN